MLKRIWVYAAAAFFLISPAFSQTIKIGMIGPLTGGGAPWGVAMSEAIKFVVDDANQAGGINVNGNKRKVEFIAYDDQFKASEAVAAYNRLAKLDGVKYIFILSTVGTLALKETIGGDDVLVLTGAYSSKAIDANTKHIIRLLSTPKEYVPFVTKWVRSNVGGERIAILNPNDESGWDILNVSAEAWEKQGYKVIARELAERNQKDFQPVLTRLIALNPDIIDLGGTSPTTAGLIVRQARELGYKKGFAALGGPGPRDIVAAAGAEAAEGMINVLYADPANKDYQKLVERFRQKIGQIPNEYIVPCFDAATVLLKAIALSGDPEKPELVSAAFRKVLPMKSLQGGEMNFGGKESMGIDAQIMTTNYVGRLKNGEPVAVGLAQ